MQCSAKVATIAIVVIFGLTTVGKPAIGAAAPPVIPQTRTIANDDSAVYQAIVAHTIQREVDEFSGAIGLKTPAPILAFDQTLMLCRGENDFPKNMGCITMMHVEAFEKNSFRMHDVMFAGRVTPAGRQELGRSFRDRNRESRPFPGESLGRFILAAPDEIHAVQTREAKRTRGRSGFGTPAYSSSGQALVFARYVCGGFCGTGWMFLLERHGESWRVLDAVVVSQS